MLSSCTKLTIAIIKGHIHKKLLEGCNVLIIGFDPNGKEYSAAIQHFNWQKAQVVKSTIESNLVGLLEQYDETCKGKLEVRVYNGIPPTGLFIVDPNTSNGFMNVQLYPFKTNLEDAPLFVLSNSEDPEWFRFYTTQFMKLWEVSKPFVIS